MSARPRLARLFSTRRTLRASVVGLLLIGSAALADDVCPRRFDAHTTGLPTACVFVGRYNAHCGGEAIALFAGDGTALVVSLATPDAGSPLFLPAQVVSATEGKLVLWHEQLELAKAKSAGKVQLEENGSRLRIAISGGALYAGECRFEEFVGHFAGMTAAGGGVANVRLRTVPQDTGAAEQLRVSAVTTAQR
jgi:hypothetical protein